MYGILIIELMFSYILQVITGFNYVLYAMFLVCILILQLLALKNKSNQTKIKEIRLMASKTVTRVSKALPENVDLQDLLKFPTLLIH